MNKKEQEPNKFPFRADSGGTDHPDPGGGHPAGTFNPDRDPGYGQEFGWRWEVEQTFAFRVDNIQHTCSDIREERNSLSHT